MTRRANTTVPLVLVLVAAEAFAHRWEMGSSRFAHYARMAMDALAFDAGHCQMLGVIEVDG